MVLATLLLYLDEASSPDMPDSAIKHQPSSKEARESLSPFDSDN